MFNGFESQNDIVLWYYNHVLKLRNDKMYFDIQRAEKY